MKTDRHRNNIEEDSRRHFLRDSSMLLASAFPAPVAKASSKPLRLGLIGCGQRGRILAAQALGCSSQLRLVGLADQNRDSIQRCFRSLNSQFKNQIELPAKARRSGRYSGSDAATELLQSEVDGVLIATPTGLKADLLELAFGSGKHVFLEQPLATNHGDFATLHRCGTLASQRQVGFVIAEETSLFPADFPPLDGCLQLDTSAGVLSPHQPQARRTQPRERDTKITHENSSVRWRGDEQLSGAIGLEQHLQHLLLANAVFSALPLAGQLTRQANYDERAGLYSGQQEAVFHYPDGKLLKSTVRFENGSQPSRPQYWADAGTQRVDLARSRRQPREAASPSMTNFVDAMCRGGAYSNFRESLQTLRTALETLG